VPGAQSIATKLGKQKLRVGANPIQNNISVHAWDPIFDAVLCNFSADPIPHLVILTPLDDLPLKIFLLSLFGKA